VSKTAIGGRLRATQGYRRYLRVQRGAMLPERGPRGLNAQLHGRSKANFLGVVAAEAFKLGRKSDQIKVADIVASGFGFVGVMSRIAK
jgi:hypothetical protein